jgi:selenocysteine lyase/cysteine desulfurase
VDVEHLEEELRRHRHRPLKIGSFSAASNVTGILTDVEEVAIVLHRHGALSSWDYASAGPYLPIDMNPKPPGPDGDLAYKDAVFLSPHKFVGGPQTPGVLVAKRSLFRNPIPTVPGGGTIMFVSPSRQTYDPAPEVREEAGTPAIVGSIRAGLVFALKEAVGAEEIHRRERAFAQQALASWSANPRIHVLGPLEPERLAIVSLGIRHPPGLLHSNFVAALLNDLFGIQARSGCFCAAPYIHRMYPIDERWSRRMAAEVSRGHLGAKLSFVRLGFNYFTDPTVVDYVIDAVHLVADQGWKLLPWYVFDPLSGQWRHALRPPTRPASLEDAWFLGASPSGPRPAREDGDAALDEVLAEARRILEDAEANPPDQPFDEPVLTRQFERIRWFPLASEALARLRAASIHGVGGAAG